MARLHSLKIKNFRGIKELEHTFASGNLFCLIGRGDSGKSSILKAIYYSLSPVWNESFEDSDFFDCDVSNPIEIEATLLDVPEELIEQRDDRFWDYIRSYDPATNMVSDEVISGEADVSVKEPALTICLRVGETLEPEWQIVCGRHPEGKRISHTQRKKFKVFEVSETVDRHFQWTKWNPLYFLHKQSDQSQNDDQNVFLEVLRKAKGELDTSTFNHFDNTITKVKDLAKMFGLDIRNTRTTIDSRDIVVKDGRLSLHDDQVPFRLKGRGSKRLLSMAIQSALCADGGIMLIDEFELGLESDRIKHAISTLKKERKAQILITTHSNHILEELGGENVLIAKKGHDKLTGLKNKHDSIVRSNPQAFFSRKVLICEGPTEIGLCRGLVDSLIANNSMNLACYGVGLLDGGGAPQFLNRYELFKSAEIPTAILCDSDRTEINDKLDLLKKVGVSVFRWDDGMCTEEAIAEILPCVGVTKLLIAARTEIMHEKGVTKEIARKMIWDSVQAQYEGPNFPAEYSATTDSKDIRKAIGKAANKKSWFKRYDKGRILGKIVFDSWDQIDNASSFKSTIESLVKWAK